MGAFLGGLSFGLAATGLWFFLRNRLLPGWALFGGGLIAAAGFWALS